jgi:hypothetical protein
MLKKIILATAIAVASLVSFHVGRGITVNAGQPAAACDPSMDPICCTQPWLC